MKATSPSTLRRTRRAPTRGGPSGRARRPAFAVLAPVALAALLAGCASTAPSASLSSWHDGAAKSAIEDFVAAVTDPAGPDHVPPAERIAVFDNDGTLWGEQPAYFQLLFAIDRVRATAGEHPEWRGKQPFQAAIDGDMKALAAGGEKALMELVMATHAGMSSEEFAAVVRNWLDTARHPVTGRRYDRMTYAPMVQLLGYLRAHGFKTFIVSGGGLDFMRVFAEQAYGIPPEQVVGSRLAVEYVSDAQHPTLRRMPKLEFLDDKEGKPVGIHQHIGRRPIAAFGNSDGDFQMLEWTTTGPGRRLGLLVHHDDGEREVAYDRESHIGKLARGLDEAAARGWVVVSMKGDWRTVHAADG